MAIGSGALTEVGVARAAEDGVAPPARASDVETATGVRRSPAADTWVTTARVQAPFSRVTIWWPSVDGTVEVAGVSVNERFNGLFEAEVGADYAANPCIRGWQLTGRLGVAAPLRRAAAQGRSWEVRLPVLASYHHLGLAGDGCDDHVEKTVQAASLSVGLDATYWTAGRWGFDIRGLAGLGRAWEEASNRPTQAGRMWDFGLAFGVSF